MVTARADFAVADDILQEATKELLIGHGPIIVERSGRIGPLVEMALAKIYHPRQYQSVVINSGFSKDLGAALHSGKSFGGAFKDQAGAFPLGLDNPVLQSESGWDQWTVHAENIAKSQGINPKLVSGLLGALGELQDNIYEHSEAPQTGVVAYAVTSSSFEFVVADRGVGVLQTLRQNPLYAGIQDAGAALQQVIKKDVSRFPSEMGRGQGFNQLFRALVGQNAELRFRSGDHALTLRPTDDALHGAAVLAQVAPLIGLSISVFYQVGGTT